jgi:hypothetical protein
MIGGAGIPLLGLVGGTRCPRRLQQRPVILAVGFHLGQDVQMTAVRLGYNQQDDDRLLGSNPNRCATSVKKSLLHQNASGAAETLPDVSPPSAAAIGECANAVPEDLKRYHVEEFLTDVG